MRVVLAHLRVQPRDVGGRDIGRVRHHQVEAVVGETRRPLGADKGAAVVQIQIGGVLARHGDGFGRDVGADAARTGALNQGGQKNSARAGAKVDKVEGALRRKGADDDVQQGLGVRARAEHVRGDVQHDLPEALFAQDARHRLALQTTRDHGLQGGELVGVDDAVGIGQNVDAACAGRRLQQQASVDRRTVDAGGFELGLRALPGGEQGRGGGGVFGHDR
ncbi:hypothetical protein D3C75_923320 [compost metagenome]